MTRHDDANGIDPVGGTYGARRDRLAEIARKLRIGDGAAWIDLPKGIPNEVLECGAAGFQRDSFDRSEVAGG